MDSTGISDGDDALLAPVTGVAFVTGAASGIGAAIARRLGAGGYVVAVAELDGGAADSVAAEIRGAGGRAASYAIDVTDEEAILRVHDAAEAALCPISVGVASAGIVRTTAITEIPRSEWAQVLAASLTGTMLLFQAVARRLLARDAHASPLAISSVSGRGGRPMEMHYAASKAGINSLVRSASLTLAPHGIRVNAICPGVIDTEMTRALDAARERETGTPASVSLAAMAARIPLGRMAPPEETAEVAAFLVGPQAGYVTGQSINVDGGFERD